jgi:hypothetical protein
MNKKLILATVIAASAPMAFGEPTIGEPLVSGLNAELDRIEASCAQVPEASVVSTKKDDKKPTFCFKGANDVDLTFDGSARVDYGRSYNTETLNSEELDRISSYNGRIEFGTVVTYGKEKYGKAAVELAARLRQQYQAGRFDKVLSTNASSVKIADSVVEVPGTSVNATIPWVKSVYLKLLINALVGKEISNDHFIKAGLFEYELGRGISYGSSYGTPKKYLGVYNGGNSFAPFGILLSGEMIKNRLEYEFYFARMEEKSSSFKDVNARTKTHIVGNKRRGAAGVEIASDVFALNIKGHYDTPRLGDIKTNSYVMYSKALDQRIEMPNDCESRLVTVGSGFEYEKGNFEFGGEVAFNMGSEYVYNIDRNVIALGRGYAGQEDKVLTTYSHVVALSGGDTVRNNKTAPVVNAIKTEVESYNGNANGITFKTGIESDSLADATYSLKNKDNRFRSAYKNTYAGWMGVIDAAYNWKPANMKFSFAAGHASGDANPNTVEGDKSYKGFVGLNENYAGKRVKSVLALGARKMQSPLTVDPNNKQLFDNSFTDLTFLGSGIVWRLPKRDLELSSNALVFFKDQRSLSYVYNSIADTGGFGSTFARRYMGLELNLSFEWKLLPGLSLLGETAVFLPGSFYKDVKGLPLDGSVVTLLDQTDSTGITQAVPRLGNDPQVVMGVALQYKF